MTTNNDNDVKDLALEIPPLSTAPICEAHGSLVCHIFRLGPGQELRSCLIDYVTKKGLSSAFVISCVGSLRCATLRLAESGIPDTALKIVTLNQHFEIVSLVGTVSADGRPHLHISLSDSEGQVFGGHIVRDLVVNTTAEVVLGCVPQIQLRKTFDPRSGWLELDIVTEKIQSKLPDSIS